MTKTPPSASARDQHDAEWVYATPLSTRLLSPLGRRIHDLSSLPHVVEVVVAACGYAFNPAAFPGWPVLVYFVSRRGLRASSSSSAAARHTSAFAYLLDSPAYAKARETLSQPLPPEQEALFLAGCYVGSALVTLALTELAKRACATTRPRIPPEGGEHARATRRRYGALVGSLKSTHAFPSGDCAQAANLCLFLWRCVPDHARAAAGKDVPLAMVLCGLFLPGVAFARVFYRCHWIEDCLGGMALAWTWHALARRAAGLADLHVAPA